MPSSSLEGPPAFATPAQLSAQVFYRAHAGVTDLAVLRMQGILFVECDPATRAVLENAPRRPPFDGYGLQFADDPPGTWCPLCATRL